jgi:putative ABC transport system ATP-binding protein
MIGVEVRNLSKTYRPGPAGEVRALTEVSLDIPAGSFALLTGPSGSGKTTLLSLIGALERPTSGIILVAGRNLTDCSDAELTRLRRRIGFVFQDFALISGLRVWENVTYHLIPRGIAPVERRRLACELLERMGLSDKAMSRPAELSGGELQRVAFARAWVGEPEMILADEPTSNLDQQSAQAVIEMLRQIHPTGKTVVISSHDPRLESLATKTFRLAAGQLVATS